MSRSKDVITPILAASQKWFDGLGDQSPAVKFYPYWIGLLLIWLAYVLAGTVSVFVSSFFSAPASTTRFESYSHNYGIDRSTKALDLYQVIVTRNLFSSLNRVPGEEAQGKQDRNNTPVRTGLPLNLVGTVILKNELRSIATLLDSGDQQVYPVRIDDEIPGKLRVVGVEARRVVFINLSSGRREYVELPEAQNQSTLTLSAPNAFRANPGGVEQTQANQFSINRTKVDSALANINQLLTQARAVPHFENGAPAGYKLIQIEPGSLYSQLGLVDNDVLCGYNGEQINDPGRALELLNVIRTASRVELCVKREGKTRTFTYDIR